MIIRGSLFNVSQIALQFHGQEDIRQLEPTSWAQILFPESDARSLLQWLRTDRSMDFQDGRFVVRAGADWLMIEDSLSGFAIQLGTNAEIIALTDELSGTLELVLGQSVDPTQ